jgi:hypothetical protein
MGLNMDQSAGINQDDRHLRELYDVLVPELLLCVREVVSVHRWCLRNVPYGDDWKFRHKGKKGPVSEESVSPFSTETTSKKNFEGV